MTAREYEVHCFSLSTSPGVGGATHFCSLCYSIVNFVLSYFVSPFACVLSKAETGGGRGWYGGWRG